ncbi:MAG: hypothetical protein KJ067_11555 [Vicinamibacteria bacterium]|nr:hypothetical protein [Vicinamibacteria bacterium]
MDASKNRALSDFYREEFLKHLQYLESSGLNRHGGGERLDRVCRRFIADLESVCWRDDFPRVAETLLQNFDALTRLSELDPRQGH